MKKIRTLIKYGSSNIRTIFKYKYGENYIFVDGFPHTKNFGDALGTPIVEFLSGKKVLPSKNISRFLFHSFKFLNYAVVGSILQWVKKDSIVWGAGFISKQDKIRSIPSLVCAVRGPLTREVYLINKIDCPEIYGDPALFLPLMYSPNLAKIYKYGIIPHYEDYKHPWIQYMKKRTDVLIIDLMVFTDYKKVVNEMLSCENIMSSSLHGLIVSDAYQIPNARIKLSDKVMGNDFKFLDYFESVKRQSTSVLFPKVSDSPADYKFDKVEITIDLKKTIEVCPFITKGKKKELVRKLQTEIKLAHLNG